MRTLTGNVRVQSLFTFKCARQQIRSQFVFNKNQFVWIGLLIKAKIVFKSYKSAGFIQTAVAGFIHTYKMWRENIFLFKFHRSSSKLNKHKLARTVQSGLFAFIKLILIALARSMEPCRHFLATSFFEVARLILSTLNPFTCVSISTTFFTAFAGKLMVPDEHFSFSHSRRMLTRHSIRLSQIDTT